MSYKIHMKLDIDLTEERVSQIREEFLAALEAHSLKTEYFECKQGSLIIDLVIVGVAIKVLDGFLAELGASFYRGFKDFVLPPPSVDESQRGLLSSTETKKDSKTPVSPSTEFENQITRMLNISSISFQQPDRFRSLEEALQKNLGTTVLEMTQEDTHCRISGIEIIPKGNSVYEVIEFTRTHTIMDFKK